MVRGAVACFPRVLPAGCPLAPPLRASGAVFLGADAMATEDENFDSSDIGMLDPDHPAMERVQFALQKQLKGA